MKNFDQIIEKYTDDKHQESFKHFLEHTDLVNFLIIFCTDLAKIKPEGKHALPSNTMIILAINSSFGKMNDYLSSIKNSGVRNQLTATTIYILCKICLEYLDGLEEKDRFQFCFCMDDFCKTGMFADSIFIKNMRIAAAEQLESLKTSDKELCENYYEIRKGHKYEIAVLMDLCKNRKLLKAKGTFEMVFGRHKKNLIMKWDGEKIVHLVLIIKKLIELEFITIKGNKGTWTAFEKHLQDFDNIKIGHKLAKISHQLNRNQNFYSEIREEIDKLFERMFEIASQKGQHNPK